MKTSKIHSPPIRIRNEKEVLLDIEEGIQKLSQKLDRIDSGGIDVDLVCRIIDSTPLPTNRAIEGLNMADIVELVNADRRKVKAELYIRLTGKSPEGE